MSGARLLGGALLAAACAAAAGAERPFLLAGTAVQEDDDERVYAIGAGVEAGHRLRAARFELEYSFEPALSVELGWSRQLLKTAEDRSRETELEAGMRRVLRDPARHGLGVAFTAELEAAREAEDGATARWSYATTTMMLPLSVQWGPVWWHLSPGLQHARGAGVQPLAAVGVQQPLARRWEAYAEWGAVRRRDGLAQAGVRYWLQREKLALDAALVHRRIEADRVDAVAVFLNVMDLSF